MAQRTRDSGLTALQICAAGPDDSDDIAAIYDHHVRHGTASFDSKGPSAPQWADKIDAALARGWPLLVVERDGAVVAYAYAT